MRLTIAVRAMRVQLASFVQVGNVDECQIPYSGDLYIVGCLYEVSSSNGTVWDETRPVTRLDAPRHFNPLGVTNNRFWTWLRWSKNAEIVYSVDCDELR